MSVEARTHIRLTDWLIVASCSIAVAGLIVVGEGQEIPKIWAAAILTCGLVLAFWGAARNRLLNASQVDRWAWAVLLSHTVFTSRVRDPRDILDSTAPTMDIMVEMAIWALIFAYGTMRLLSGLSMLRGLRNITARSTLAFFALAFLSATYAASPVITLAWSFKLLTTILMALVLCYSEGPLRPEERFVSASFLGLLLMLGQFVLLGALSPAAAWDRSDATGIWRLGGFILPATQLSAVCGMIVIVLVIDTLSRKQSRFTLPLMGLACLVMLTSLGRSGMIATALAMAFVFIHYRRTRLLMASLVVLPLIIIAVPGLSGLSWELLSRRQTADQIGSLTGRVQLWETAVDLILEHPFLGWGYVSGSRIAFLTAFRWWPAIHTHNFVLEVLLTLGSVGAFVLLSMLGLTLAGLGRLLRAGINDPSIVKMIALLIIIVVDGMFTSGIGGAPRFEAVILIGSALCVGAVQERARA